MKTLLKIFRSIFTMIFVAHLLGFVLVRVDFSACVARVIGIGVAIALVKISGTVIAIGTLFVCKRR